MKNLALILAICAATATVTEAATTTGFYVGASAGVGSTAGKIDISEDDTVDALLDDSLGEVEVPNHTRFTNDVGDHYGVGTIYAGYGWTFGNGYLGAEADFTFSGDEINMKLTDGSNGYILKGKYESDYAVGLSLMPGYKTSASTLAFLRLGVNFRKPKFSFRYIDTSTLNAYETTPSFKTSKSKNRASFVLGLGIETEMTKCVLFRVEGSYEFGPGRFKVSKGPSIDNNNYGYSEGYVTLERYSASISDLKILSAKAGITFKI